MRFWRLIAATAVVSAVLGGGLYTLGQAVHGQAKTRVLHGSAAGAAGMADDGFAIFSGDGGSQIGVAVRDVETADVTRQKLTGPSGAVVDEVRSETPAAKAGVKAGDVVVGFDGERVRSARQLERLVDETPAGRAVKMAVVRDGTKVDLDITPEGQSMTTAMKGFMPGEFAGHARTFERHVEPGVRAERIEPGEMARTFKFRGEPATEFDFDDAPFAMVMGRSRLGVQVEGLDGQLAKYFGVETGALVRGVTEDSPAAKAGLKAGDVITAANGKPVKDAGDLLRALNDIENGKPVALSVTRDRKTLSLQATLESPDSAHPRTRRIL
jgi:serine protease Do